MHPRRRQLLALPLLLGTPFRAAPAADEAGLVLARPGELPIVITAPHGGAAKVPGVEPRDVKGKGDLYRDGQDTGTDRIALGIAATIRELTGRSPWLVVARFHRRYLDANRPPGIAYENPAAMPFYERYHAAIRRSVDEIRARYPNGLLLDVHGNVKLPEALTRGTINGKSVTRLLARAGFDGVTGGKGLFGLLEAHGFKVFPGNGLPPMARHEDAGFNGGYTCDLYGSHRADGIDAMQLEFGTVYRRKEAIDDSARRAGRAVVEFHRAYLA